MKHYETMVVVPPNVKEAELNSLVEAFTEDLKNRHSASDVNVQVWGKRVLAYPIKKFTEGYYILCDYHSDNENTVSDFESRLRLSENVIRFLTIRRDLEEKTGEKLRAKLLKRKTKVKEEPTEEYDNFNYEENDLD